MRAFAGRCGARDRLRTVGDARRGLCEYAVCRQWASRCHRARCALAMALGTQDYRALRALMERNDRRRRRSHSVTGATAEWAASPSHAARAATRSSPSAAKFCGRVPESWCGRVLLRDDMTTQQALERPVWRAIDNSSARPWLADAHRGYRGNIASIGLQAARSLRPRSCLHPARVTARSILGTHARCACGVAAHRNRSRAAHLRASSPARSLCDLPSAFAALITAQPRRTLVKIGLTCKPELTPPSLRFYPACASGCSAAPHCSLRRDAKLISACKTHHA